MFCCTPPSLLFQYDGSPTWQLDPDTGLPVVVGDHHPVGTFETSALAAWGDAPERRVLWGRYFVEFARWMQTVYERSEYWTSIAELDEWRLPNGETFDLEDLNAFDGQTAVSPEWWDYWLQQVDVIKRCQLGVSASVPVIDTSSMVDQLTRYGKRPHRRLIDAFPWTPIMTGLFTPYILTPPTLSVESALLTKQYYSTSGRAITQVPLRHHCGFWGDSRQPTLRMSLATIGSVEIRAGTSNSSLAGIPAIVTGWSHTENFFTGDFEIEIGDALDVVDVFPTGGAVTRNYGFWIQVTAASGSMVRPTTLGDRNYYYPLATSGTFANVLLGVDDIICEERGTYAGE